MKDSAVGTLVVAGVLCMVCSILVSGAAVGLKDRQEANKSLDVKKNLLLASGLLKDSSAGKEEILEKYKMIQPELIHLDTGEVVTDIDLESFDQRKAAKDPEMNVEIPREEDLAKIKQRSKYSTVYKVMENGEVAMLILPVNGKGLWSTLYGFLALSADLKEIRGIGFYEHAETPGLGGEVDNPKWKSQWKGKVAFDEDMNPKIQVIKGQVAATDPQKEYKVDGLSGATITANGVTGLVQYWLGSDGFGPYLKKYQSASAM